MSRKTITVQFGSGGESDFMAAMEVTRAAFLNSNVCLGYSITFGPWNSGSFVTLEVDYDDRAAGWREFVERIQPEPRYELTDLGKAYRDAMQRGANLNGGVKAGEDSDAPI